MRSFVSNGVKTYSDCYQLPHFIRRLSFTCLEKGHRVSLLIHDFYSLSGILCIARIVSISLQVASLSHKIGDCFKKTIHQFENLKGILYATMWMDAIPQFYHFDKNNCLVFHLPLITKNDPKSGTDYVNLLFALSGFCIAANYLQRMNICRISLLTKLSNAIGNVKVFSIRRTTWTINDVPIICSVANDLSELFSVLASSGEIWRWIKSVYVAPSKKERRHYFSLLPILRLATSSARLIGLSLHRQCKTHKIASLILLGINFIGQWSAFGGMAIDKYQQRNRRFLGLE